MSQEKIRKHNRYYDYHPYLHNQNYRRIISLQKGLLMLKIPSRAFGSKIYYNKSDKENVHIFS